MILTEQVISRLWAAGVKTFIKGVKLRSRQDQIGQDIKTRTEISRKYENNFENFEGDTCSVI